MGAVFFSVRLSHKTILHTTLTNRETMKENKLGRKYANTWSPPNRIRCKRNHNYATRRANKGVRKNAKLMIKAELGEVCNGESNQTVNLVSYDKVGATPTFLTN